MISSAGWIANSAEYTGRLDEYKGTVKRLFPMLPKNCLDIWSISEADTLALGLLLDSYSEEVAVLDIGTFVGVSAFFFASHPKVAEVVSVDPNPTVADEIEGKSQLLGAIDSKTLRHLKDLKVLDVARAVLAEFPEENRKIDVRVGTVDASREPSSAPGKVAAPILELSDERPLIAFVDGLHTKEGVLADLKAVFAHNPHAIAILDDCRHAWGPFVQAGVASFMEENDDEYEFQLLADIGPGVSTSNLGIVYPRVDGAEVKKTLSDFSELFSERLDLLRLLQREEELIATVNQYKEAAREASKLQERNARLEEDNSEQRERNNELAQRNSEIGERNSELAERNNELVRRNSELRAQHEYEISKYDERIDKHKDRASRLKERISGLEERITRLDQQNARLEERNLELREENAQLVGENSQQNSQLVVYRSGRRYRIADAVAESLRWVPDTPRRARRQPEQ